MLEFVDERDWELRPDERVPQPAPGRFRDYVLTDYEPLADPAGRLHSSTLLRYFSRVHRLEALAPLLARVRELVGEDETVWGVKYWAEPPSLVFDHAGIELYFYNRDRNRAGNPKSVARLTEGLRPLLRTEGSAPEHLPYLMCSIELDARVLASGRSEGFRVYVPGDRRKQGYDGVSYLARSTRLERENLYQFYRAEGEAAEFRARLAESVHARSDDVRRALAPQELVSCFTLCFAQKRWSDAVYFSRIDTDRLLRFLSQRMPGPLAGVVQREAAQLAHLRWDVGIDFASTDGGRSTHVTKAGFYGLL